MTIKISVESDNPAASEVNTALLYEEISKIEGLELGSGEKATDKISRLSGLEVLATFITSAAALQLAMAVRDFVKRQSVKVKFTTPDGRTYTLAATGGDPDAIADIVGFLTKQHKKISKTKP